MKTFESTYSISTGTDGVLKIYLDLCIDNSIVGGIYALISVKFTVIQNYFDHICKIEGSVSIELKVLDISKRSFDIIVHVVIMSW